MEGTKIRIAHPELEALETLNSKNVEYLLVGGFALRFYGRRRRTNDVDLLTNNTKENAARLYKAIVVILGYKPSFGPSSLEQPMNIVRLGSFGPNVDILTSVEGLSFGTAYAKREIAHENGIIVPVASKKDLLFIKRIEAKKASKRFDKASADIAFLESL